MSNTLRIMCPNLGCRRVLAVPAQARGKMVRCSGCQTAIRIPGQPEAGPKPVRPK